MRCYNCGKDPDPIVLLQVPQPDGALEVFSCIDCAKKTPAYCVSHERPKLRFEDGTFACIACIETRVLELQHLTDRYFDRLSGALDAAEFLRLVSWAEESSRITGSTIEVSVLRQIVTLSVRTGKKMNEIINEAVRTRSAEPVLPTSYWPEVRH